MSKIVVVVVKEPGKAAERREINAGLEAMQAVVGGNIELVPWGGFDLFCHEDGRIIGLEPNVQLPDTLPDPVLGPVFVSKANEEGETVSLNEAEVKAAITMLNNSRVA